MIRVVCDAAVIDAQRIFSQWSEQLELIRLPSTQIDAMSLGQADALITRSVTQVDATLLSTAKRLSFVGTATIGTDHVDHNFLKRQGIKLASAAGCSKHAVAQYVIATIHTLRPKLLANPKHSALNRSASPHRLTQAANQPVMGIVGFGHIGSSLARYGQAFGFEVLVHDPYVKSTHEQPGLQALLERADVVSLHVPLSQQGESQHRTHHLIAERELSWLKSGALLINTARGAVVAEQALIHALQTKADFDAALDVFEFEPKLNPQLIDLLSLSTPHVAGYSLQGKLNATQLVAYALAEHFGLSTPTTELHERFWLPDSVDFIANWYQPKADEARLKQSAAPASAQIDPGNFEALRKSYRLRTDWGFTKAALDQRQ